MSDVTDHYDRLLAEHYSWMLGVPAAEKAREQRELLERGKVEPGELAIDLGAGPGYQSIALSDLGFRRVLAIDTSAALLAELRRHAGRRAIETIHGDMMDLLRHVSGESAAAVVCMGDTLTHLTAPERVPQLFAAVATALRSGGRFVLSYRDLSVELKGTDRFIPVRSSPDKIMTCFLEYAPDRVRVHDLVHVREGDRWQLQKSWYPKLRLPVEGVRHDLESAGLQVDFHESVRGMTILAARKN
jgi:SAM-dependent methyltransferase